MAQFGKGKEKCGEGILIIYSQLSPPPTKVGTRTCFFLVTQRAAALSQSSFSCTPRTSLSPQGLLINPPEENLRCKSHILSISTHPSNSVCSTGKPQSKGKTWPLLQCLGEGNRMHRVNSPKNLNELKDMVLATVSWMGNQTRCNITAVHKGCWHKRDWIPEINTQGPVGVWFSSGTQIQGRKPKIYMEVKLKSWIQGLKGF